MGKPFIELLTVESTNNYAMGLVRAGMAQHGTTVFAHEQTKGKGQRNRQWASEQGKNIAISIVIEPMALASSEIFFLSMMAAVSVHHLLEKYIDTGIKIKWPNDIYWRDRKAAGILIENLWQGSEWKFAVIGIGINVNQTDFGELGTRAVSLKQIIGKEFEPVGLARELCAILEENYQLLVQSSAKMYDEYKPLLYKMGEAVRLKKDNRSFEATIKDVSPNGELIVQHAIEERFNVGEVEWVSNGG
jgi:BirA family biotin operon repressor/biotin-[acetyl-CoA-carboxylase] ligase